MTEKESRATMKGDLHRLQFDFSDEAVGRLDEIVEKTEAPTRAAAVRKALHFYHWAVEQAEQNKPINLTPDLVRLVCGLPQKDSDSNGGET